MAILLDKQHQKNFSARPIRSSYWFKINSTFFRLIVPKTNFFAIFTLSNKLKYFAMSLYEKVENDIKAAMLAKEKEKLEALRAIKAAFLLAKTEKGAAETLSEDTELKVIQKLVKQRKESAELYRNGGRNELADSEMFQAEVISQYLPAQMSEAEIEAEVRKIVEAVGAKGPQDMGKVMGTANKQLSGKAESRVIAQKVKEILASL